MNRQSPATDLLRMPIGVARVPLPESDETLVNALLEHRPGAAATLFDRHAVHVRRILTRVLGADPELLELVRGVFVMALKTIRRLGEPRALRTWLTQLAVTVARAKIRQRNRWQFLRRGLSARSPHSEASYQGEEPARATYRVLSRLRVDERVAFALLFIDGMDLNEVADACQASRATVKRRLGRAELRFRELSRSEPALADWHGAGQ